MTCSPIQPNLWVGPDPRDDEDFKNLQSLNITAVLSLQDEEDRGDGGIESERSAAARVGLAFESVPVKDFSNADLQLCLPKCVAALAHLLGQGHTVYVHCTAGVSRSPTVVAAYLHWCSGWDLDQALVHVMQCRQCIRLRTQYATPAGLAVPESELELGNRLGLLGCALSQRVNMQIDLHGYHPAEIVWSGVLAKIVEQAWEMGERELILIHGHGRNRGITPGFVHTNTGFFGLQIRSALRHDKNLRRWIHHTTLDCSNPGLTSVSLKPNRSPVRTSLDLKLLPD